MQPQGHAQLLLSMDVFGLNPQQAIDAPRICPAGGTREEGKKPPRMVFLEGGIPAERVKALRELGREVEVLKGHRAGDAWREADYPLLY